MPHDDADYFRRRADQERARADLHDDPDIAQLHRTLAELYDQRVQTGGAIPLRRAQA
jgi:hypothetical protein